MELKPCPFCGSEAKLYKDIWDEEEGGVSYYVKCTGHCFCETWYYDTESEAIEAWQSRVGEGGKGVTKREKLDAIAERVDLFPHECVIGLLHHHEEGELATLARVKAHIVERVRYNRHLRNLGIESDWLYQKEWSLRDYTDKRKSTNLTRFDFCPECGKKIDWKAIRKEEPT